MRAPHRSIALFVAPSFATAALALESGTPEQPASPCAEPVLRRSEVVFLYASTRQAYEAYRATFVAWGGAESRERVEEHRALGIRSTGSVWCLTAGAKALYEDPALREAVAVDIEGKPIAVPWLFDHTHEGQRTLFGNTNHPVFREHVRAAVRRAMAGGADGLHVDDHLGVAASALFYGGGFDDWSIAGFRAYLAARAPKERLEAAGVEDLAAFDYRDLVRKHAKTAEEVQRKSGEIPLFDLWKEYHLDAAADFVEELRSVAAEAAGHPVLLSANACLQESAHHRVVPRLTHVVCEVWFDGHRGTESLDGALRAFAAADRLGRPLACTASGQDWSTVKDRDAKDLVRFWIAFTYAHGHRFMVPHPERQWCFDEVRGTRWYAAPIEEFAPFYRFVRENASVFDRFENCETAEVRAVVEGARGPGARGLVAKPRAMGKTLAVHLVNLDYDLESGRFREARGVRVEVRGPAAEGGPRRARLLRPEAPAAELAVATEGGALVLAVGEVRIWAIALIEPAPEGGGT